MGFSVNIPWNKYGIIVELAKRLQDISPQFGKTALQKMVYLLTELFNVPTGYEFTLYTYGPYSADLTSDMDFTAAMGGVSLYNNSNGGFEIKINEKSSLIEDKSHEFLKKHAQQFDALVDSFGDFTARELELRSTLIFLAKPQRITIESLAHQLIELKPYFSLSEVKETINDLQNKGFLKIKQ